MIHVRDLDTLTIRVSPNTGVLQGWEPFLAVIGGETWRKGWRDMKWRERHFPLPTWKMEEGARAKERGHLLEGGGGQETVSLEHREEAPSC